MAVPGGGLNPERRFISSASPTNSELVPASLRLGRGCVPMIDSAELSEWRVFFQLEKADYDALSNT